MKEKNSLTTKKERRMKNKIKMVAFSAVMIGALSISALAYKPNYARNAANKANRSQSVTADAQKRKGQDSNYYGNYQNDCGALNGNGNCYGDYNCTCDDEYLCIQGYCSYYGCDSCVDGNCSSNLYSNKTNSNNGALNYYNNQSNCDNSQYGSNNWFNSMFENFLNACNLR